MEEWKPVPGYPGYEASNLGRIRSLTREIHMTHKGTPYTKVVKGRILKQCNNSRGYLCVMMGKKNQVPVHRIITLTFLPNKYDYKCVDHIDSNPKNNNINNLRWCNYKMNNNALHHRRAFSYPVVQMSMDGDVIKVWPSMAEAKHQLRISHIYSAVNGKRPHAGGFKWKKYGKDILHD